MKYRAKKRLTRGILFLIAFLVETIVGLAVLCYRDCEVGRAGAVDVPIESSDNEAILGSVSRCSHKDVPVIGVSPKNQNEFFIEDLLGFGYGNCYRCLTYDALRGGKRWSVGISSGRIRHIRVDEIIGQSLWASDEIMSKSQALSWRASHVFPLNKENEISHFPIWSLIPRKLQWNRRHHSALYLNQCVSRSLGEVGRLPGLDNSLLRESMGVLRSLSCLYFCESFGGGLGG